MEEKRLSYTAEKIDEILHRVESGNIGGGASPEQIQQIQTNANDIAALKSGKLDASAVAEWAKAPEKPSYTPEEVGAQPKGNYLTAETDPTVPDWAKQATKPTYTAGEVNADPKGTAASAVSGHNINGQAHSDIRLLITELTNRLNAVANSTDTDLDQIAELVAYIKSNRTLIEQVTTNKVSVADIINNLTTNVSNKPLSAAQGVALKGLIDAIKIPDISGKADKATTLAGYGITDGAKASDLTSHTGNTTVHITSSERTKWNKAVTDVGALSEEIVDLKAMLIDGNEVAY